MMSDKKQAFAKLICENWKTKVKHMTCMGTPESVIESSKDYMKACNEVMVWFEDNYVETDDPSEMTKARDMYNDFKIATRNKNITGTAFGNRLNKMNIKKIAVGKNKISYRACKPKPAEFINDD